MGKINKNVLYVLGGGLALFLVVAVLSPASAAYKTEVINGTTTVRSAAPVGDTRAPATSTREPVTTLPSRTPVNPNEPVKTSPPVVVPPTKTPMKACPAMTKPTCAQGQQVLILHDANNCESFICQSSQVKK